MPDFTALPDGRWARVSGYAGLIALASYIALTRGEGGRNAATLGRVVGA